MSSLRVGATAREEEKDEEEEEEEGALGKEWREKRGRFRACERLA
jgi:hypothetical protein